MMEKVKTVFRVQVPDEAEVEMGSGSNQVGNPNHVFPLAFLRMLLVWISGQVARTFYVCGPTGCGKTSTLVEFAIALGIKVFVVGISVRAEYSETLGYVQLVPINNETETESDDVKKSGFLGVMMKIVSAIRSLARSAVGTKFIHGDLGEALVTSAKEKVIVVLDEFDQGRDNIAFNKLLDGRDIRLPSGQVLSGRNVWIAATGNTVGGVDERGQYSGVAKQNVVSGNRFCFHFDATYMEPECEEELLEKEAPELPEVFRKLVVSFANQMRSLYEAGELEIPLATRTLVFWAKLAVELTDTPGLEPLKDALVTVFTNQNQRDDRVKVMALWQRATET